jgi:serine protease AprX
VLAAVALSGGQPDSQQNVHPAVFDWVTENPGEPVPVLLLHTDDAEAVAQAVTAAGGQVARRFDMISTIEAELPAGSIASLAAHPAVVRVTLDAPVVSTDTNDGSTSAPASTYPFSIGAHEAWSAGFTGRGVAIAVVDTGVSPSGHEDFNAPSGNSRVIAEVVVNSNTSNVTDGFGHGTHIAGIAGGDGSLMDGKWVGVAPEVNLVNVKISADDGSATLSDLIAGLEWVYNNKDRYNIRVVNLSLHSAVPESYRSSPLDAAVEFLWFNNIFVVVAAGNLGSATDAVFYPPANDPFVMTVGAIDDKNTTNFDDDQLAEWSSRGTTQDGFPKPELTVPGRNIVSVIDTNSILYRDYPDRRVDDKYFRLSGTSMAAGVMSGAAAIVLQAHPGWTPGQVKCSLMASARSVSGSSAGVPRLGLVIAMDKPACNSDDGLLQNAGFGPLLKIGAIAWVLGEPNPKNAGNSVGIDIEKAAGKNAKLSNVDWSAISWDAVKWASVKWDAIKWDAIKWDAIKWSAIKWSNVTPEGVNFSAVKWSAIKWSAIKWDAIKWSGITWDAIKWDAIKWDAIKWDFLSEP